MKQELINKPTQSKSIFIGGVLIIFLLLVLAILYYNSSQDYILLIEDTQPLFNDYQKIIRSDKLSNPNGFKMTYIIWLYFDNNNESSNWFSNFTDDKYILDRDGTPSIKYNPSKNSIVIEVKIKDVYNKDDNTIDFRDKKQRFEMYGVPIQKWTQLAVVFNNRYIDVYMDTVLHKTIFLDNVPVFNNADVILGRKRHNPNCFVGIVEYKPDIISLTELNALYIRWNGRLKIDPKLRGKIQTELNELKYTDNPEST